MKKKEELILDLDSIIKCAQHRFTEEELAKLGSIREHLVRAKKIEDVVKWGTELLKFMEIVHELFKK